MGKINRPLCEKHPYCHLTGLGCVLCNGERLAAGDRLRGVRAKTAISGFPGGRRPVASGDPSGPADTR